MPLINILFSYRVKKLVDYFNLYEPFLCILRQKKTMRSQVMCSNFSFLYVDI